MLARTLLIVGSLETDETPGGIHVYAFDPDGSSVTWLSTANDIGAPSFIAIDSDASRLYAVDERPAGTLSAYALNATTGRLTLIDRRPALGDLPCHVGLDRRRRFAFVSNFGAGPHALPSAQSIAILPTNGGRGLAPAVASVVHQRTGTLSPHQDAPHAHCAIASPDNRFVFATNYGGDQIFAYPFDDVFGSLGTPASVCQAPDGSGPRSIVVAPDGATAFVTCELSSSLATLSVDRTTGRLSIESMASTLPRGWSGPNYPAELRLGRDGRRLYVSNRGHDSVATFVVEDGRANLAAVHPSGGNWPRCLDLSNDGRRLVVANQKSGEIVAFAIDPATGKPQTPTTILNSNAPAFVALATFGARAMMDGK